MKGNSSYRLVAEPGKPEIIETSVFDAPRELVFKTMNDPKLIPKWLGPRNLTTTVDEMDFRPGGKYRYIHRDAEGKKYVFSGVFREIAPPERTVLTFNYEAMPSHESVVTTTFEEQNGRTKVSSKTVFQSVEDRDGMLQSGMESGARETMDRFAELLDEIQTGKYDVETSGARSFELVISRVFDAPRELVWKAWTDCTYVTRWWGPKGFTAPFCKNDIRVGGKSLYAMRAPMGKEVWSGKTIWSTGIYREVVPSKRIVTTDSFADEMGNVVPATQYGMNPDFPLELLVTVTFEDYEGKTQLTLHHVGFPSEADRDGAREGWNESLDKFAKVIAELKKEKMMVAGINA